MKKTTLQGVLKKVEDMFQNFNSIFYDGELEQPIITISPDMTKGAYGWCTTWRAWKDGESDDGYYEINICAEYLNRPFEEVCATLLHEMVHLWCLQNGIKDTSRGDTYHNGKFKKEAEEHGLVVEKHEKYGWTITYLSEEAKEIIHKIYPNEKFELHRTKEKITNKKKGSNSRKYVCPLCGTIVRATKEVHIMCADCDEIMVQEG